jgi:SAM-dependent methyltransferase
MMRSVVSEALVSLLGFVLIGCSADHRDAPSPFLLREEGRPAAPTTPTTGGRKAAVVFVEFVATPQDVVERMLEMAGVTRGDVLYDLGCGDGRIVVTAAHKYGCRAVGYDLDPLRVGEARGNAARHGVSHLVTIEIKDVLKADLQEASVVTLYLGTEINARLIPQLEKLRPGARIVSHDFGLGDIPPDKTVEMISDTDGLRHTIYLWTCPLQARSR